jgi:hypothetical protein
MTRTIWIIAALLVCFGSAEAQVPRVVKILEKSYELELRDVSFPSDALGSITVRPCDTCSYTAHTTTASTIFLVNDKPVVYDDFVKTVDERRKTSRPTFVGVYYDIESKHVTRVSLKAR